MNSRLERRLKALEQRKQGQEAPGYISVEREEDLPEVLARAGRRVKVYIGFSPDEWDEELEDIV